MAVLEAELVWLCRAVVAGSHGEAVALLPLYLRVVELVEGAGQGACRVSGLGNVCGLGCLAVDSVDGRWIVVVKLTV